MRASLYNYSVSRSFFPTPSTSISIPIDNGKRILTDMDSNDSGIAFDLHEDKDASIESEFTITEDGRVTRPVDLY